MVLQWGAHVLEDRAVSIFALSMEAAESSEALVSCHITAWHLSPEDLNLCLECHESLKLNS
jgi:hypothetical protein